MVGYMINTIMLPNVGLTTILIGYLITQLAFASAIYWMLSSAANKEMRRIVGDAGYDYFINGFDAAARESIMSIMKDTHEQTLMTAELAINTAKELASKTAKEADVVSSRLATIDRQLSDLSFTFGKIDQIRNEMHDTNKSMSDLHTRLTTFFERYNANQS